MAQVVHHYSADRGLLEGSQSWRWDGARWVRPDEVEPIDSIAESVEEQQLGSETLDPLISAQHLAQLGHPDVHSFQSKERLPASSNETPSWRDVGRRAYDVQALPSYAPVAGGDSLSKLAVKIRARGMQHFVEDIKPSAEFDRRRKTHLSSEKGPISRGMARAGKKQLGAVVESRLPLPVSKPATRNTAVDKPRPAKCQTLSFDVDEVLASGSRLRQKLDGVAEILKDEGNKQFIDPRTIARLAHGLQRLAEEWTDRNDGPNELGEAALNLKTDLKKLEERIARLEYELRAARGMVSTAIKQLRSEISDSSRQWHWVWRITAGSALCVAVAVVGFVFGPSWWHALIR